MHLSCDNEANTCVEPPVAIAVAVASAGLWSLLHLFALGWQAVTPNVPSQDKCAS